MRQTLFYWPHEMAGVPWFGPLSWGTGILALLIIGFVIAAGSQEKRKAVVESQWFTWLLFFLGISFLLPRIEFQIDEVPVGLPIRGYGVMLMLGVITGTWVALKRCEARGIARDAFFSLATWTVAAGVVGARLFYVVQYWDKLPGETLIQKLGVVLQVTEGGLVVYGSVIGGLIVIAIWTFRYRYPIFTVADAVTPAFFVGLLFGRVGCFLNGCCYGGICESTLPSVAFPSGSVVYMEQLESGRMLGIVKEGQTIKRIVPNSWAATSGIRESQTLNWVAPRMLEGPTPQSPHASSKFAATVAVDQVQRTVDSASLPAKALPVHPSQLYAAMGGLVLFLWTISLSSVLRRPGQIFAAGLISYGCVRIMEEIIRIDEGGQFGTSLSIATWISIAGILGGLLIFGYHSMVPPKEIDKGPTGP